MKPAVSGPAIGSLCTGVLGLDLAVEHLVDGRLAWCAEVDAGARKVISARTAAPNLGDLTRVDWTEMEPVDVMTAGWPCQPFSQAGRQRGADDERAIWPHILRAIGVLRPRLVVMENVDAIRRADALGRSELGRVTRDLAGCGYRVGWRRSLAADAGAPHQRPRVFLVAADPGRPRLERRQALPGPHQFDSGTHGVDPAGRVAPPSWGCPGCGGLDADCATCNLDLRVAHDWGEFWPRIERWAQTTGWWPPAARDHDDRLTARMSEWLQGFEPGWITDAPGITRTEAIRCAGNAVNPWQAVDAITHILDALALHEGAAA